MRMIAAAFLLISALPVLAQTMTTAAEIKPILAVTQASWVAVREYDGKDLVYFTHLMSWRCGLTSVAYGLNGAEPVTVLPMEPCYEDEASPNALKMDQGIPIFIEAALGSVQSIKIAVTYDDGSSESAEFDRKSVLMPG